MILHWFVKNKGEICRIKCITWNVKENQEYQQSAKRIKGEPTMLCLRKKKTMESHKSIKRSERESKEN